MRSLHRSTLLVVMAVLVAGMIFGGATTIRAQDEAATPVAVTGRPAHIHEGTCDEVGAVVGPLTNLTAPVGAAAGSADVDIVEYSFTTVAASLETILAADHALNVHLSEDEIGTYIACGNVGGAIDANGSLVISLREQNDSGFSGIAVLTPNGADPASTDVSAFIHQDEEADDALDETGNMGTPESDS